MHKEKPNVFDELRSWIIKGQFQEGQYISSTEICTLFKVSQVPVREVLIRLSERGLLYWEKRRGFRIASCEICEFLSIINIKRSLFEKAIERLNPSSVSYDRLIDISNKVNNYLIEDVDWTILEDVFIEYNKTIMSDFEFHVFQISCDRIHSYHRKIFSCHPGKVAQRLLLLKKAIDNTIKCCKGKTLEFGFKIIDDDLHNFYVA